MVTLHKCFGANFHNFKLFCLPLRDKKCINYKLIIGSLSNLQQHFYIDSGASVTLCNHFSTK